VASMSHVVAAPHSTVARRRRFVSGGGGLLSLLHISQLAGIKAGDRMMSYKDLLVVLDSDAASRRRADLAVALAERFAAHLVGLYPLPVPEAPHHLSYYDPAVLDPFFLDLREQAQAASEVEREAFEHAASLRGLSVEWRVIAEG